jgi:hypothetical protein
MKSESIGIDHPRVQEIQEMQELKRQARKERSKRNRGEQPTGFTYPRLSETEYAKQRAGIQENMWAGRRCFIVGGGPSLKGFRFSRLKNELTIGINRAYEKFDPSIIFGADRRFFQWANEGKYGTESLKKWKATKAPKIRLYIEGNGDIPGLENLLNVQCYGKHGLSSNLKDGLVYGSNSGYAALNLAILLGANPIYLLGFDMHPYGGYWHDGYPGKQGDITGFIHEFKSMKSEILQKARVINLNRNSNLKCFEFGDFPTGKEKLIDNRFEPLNMQSQQKERIEKRIKHDKKWILVSLYTIDTPYEEKIKELKSTIKNRKIDYCLFGKLPLGDWRKNLNHKSGIILKAMEMFPCKDIVFVDADAKVNKYPVLFDRLSKEKQANIAACFHEYKESVSPGSLLSGTLWIKNCKKSKGLIMRWHEIGLKNEKIRHQHCLRLAIDEFNMDSSFLQIYRLPTEYTYIFDYHYGKQLNPVITHYQASRKFREQVGQSIMLRDSDFTASTGNYIK